MSMPGKCNLRHEFSGNCSLRHRLEAVRRQALGIPRCHPALPLLCAGKALPCLRFPLNEDKAFRRKHKNPDLSFITHTSREHKRIWLCRL